ncbi:hypothetical protein EJB05_24350, partial [Eragrostis curvula]
MAKTASARCTQSCRATVPVLPDDLVLWEILVRLPATVLLRCRTVCRSWRRLTSAADFVLAHHRRQPSLPLVTFDGDQHQSRTLDAFDLRRSPAERRPVLRFHDYDRRGEFTVIASCDGLLLLSLSNGGFSICNPVTHQWTELPTSLTGVNVVGTYLHSSPGEYRVLYWKWMDGRRYQGTSVVYYVLTVGSSAKPRCIGMIDVMNQPSSFRSMPSPITSYHWARSRLLEMDGVLGISHLYVMESVVKLWVLDDYELKEFPLDRMISRPVGYWFKESLVSHMFFQRELKDGVVCVSDASPKPLPSCHPNTEARLERVHTQATGLVQVATLSAGAMAKTARERRTIPALPDDLVLWEILIRLPATALLRCRAVCRSWRSLTSTVDFLLDHHRRQPSLPLISFNGDVLCPRSTDAIDLRRSPAERRPILRFIEDDNRRCDFVVRASCDGLLLMSLSNKRFSICNPVTSQWIELPPSLAGVEVLGMYLHNSSGEYRVLYWKKRVNIFLNDDTVVYNVITVGSSEEPRCIGQPVASPSIEQFIKAGLTYVRFRPPVVLHSCLHWGQWSLENQLIVFDTVVESFRCMRSPITSYHSALSHLLEIDGVIGISHMDESKFTVELWLLQDYELEVWSLKYRIELPMAQMRNITNNWYYNGLVVSGNGDVLVYFGTNLHLFHCDSKGNLLQEFSLDRAILRPVGYFFKESLVRHTFFQTN